MALFGWLGWLKRHPMHQKFASSIPGQGIYKKQTIRMALGLLAEKHNSEVLLNYFLLLLQRHTWHSIIGSPNNKTQHTENW